MTTTTYEQALREVADLEAQRDRLATERGERVQLLAQLDDRAANAMLDGGVLEHDDRARLRQALADIDAGRGRWIGGLRMHASASRLRILHSCASRLMTLRHKPTPCTPNYSRCWSASESKMA